MLPLTVYDPMLGEVKAGTRQEIEKKIHRGRLLIAFCPLILFIQPRPTCAGIALPTDWVSQINEFKKEPAPQTSLQTSVMEVIPQLRVSLPGVDNQN